MSIENAPLPHFISKVHFRGATVIVSDRNVNHIVSR